MISQRLRGIGEDGEAIDGLVPKLQKAFKEYANIDIQDENGELRSTYDILSDLAKVYPSLTSKRRQYLGELAAGNRQVKVLNAIVSNWQDVEQAVGAATNSVGSAAQENAAFMDSIQGRLNELQSKFQEFSANTINSEFVKSIINAGIEVLDFIDRIGGLQTILITIGGLLVAKNFSKISSGIHNVFESIHTSIFTIIDDFNKAKQSGQGFFSSLSSAFSGSGINGIGLSIGVITTAISAYMSISSAMEQAEQERIQAAIDTSNKAQAQSEQIFDLASRYMYLSEAVKTDASAKKDLLEVQKELIDNLGAEKTGIDNVTLSLKQQSAEQLRAQRNTILAGIVASEDKMKSLNDDGITGSGKDFTNSLNYLKDQGFQNVVTGLNGGTFGLRANINAQNALENYNLVQKAMQSLSDHMGVAEAQNDQVFQSLAKVANEYSAIIQEYKDQVNAANQRTAEIDILSKVEGIPKTQAEFDSMRESLVETVKSSQDFVKGGESIESVVDGVLATMPDFSKYMGEADTTMESMASTAQEASKSLEDMTSTVNSLKEILANFAENGTFSAEDLNSLIELDPNLEDDVYRYIAGLQSADELVEAIKQSSKEAESLYRDNVLDKLWPDIAKQKQIVNTMSNLYALDAQNYVNMEEAKAAVKVQLESQKWLTSSARASDFVNLYLADFQNYAQFEQAKSQIVAGVLTQIQDLSAAQITQLATQYGVDLSNFTNIEAQKPEIAARIANKLIQTYGVVSDAQKQALQSQLDALEQKRQQILSSPIASTYGAKDAMAPYLAEINEQIATLKAALSSADSYDEDSFLAKLQEVIDGIDVTLPETNNLLKDTKDAAKDAGNAASDAAQKALDDLQSMNDELQKSLDELNNDRENIESLLDTVMSMLQQRYDDELERLDELIEKQEEQRDKEIEALEAETKAYTDKIDAQLESIRAKEEERKFNEELEEKSKDLADLQAELLALQLDNSDYGKKKRLELEEEIAEKTKELNDFQHDHSVDLQEDALEKEKENAEEALDAKKEALEKECQAVIDNYDKQRKALEAYLKDEWNLRQEAYRLINKGGQKLYNDLIEYNRHYGNAVDADVKQQWDKAYASLKKYNDGQINVRSTLEKISSSAVTLQNKIDALAPKIENARKKADSLKGSLDKSTSAVENTISKVGSLTGALEKAKKTASEIKVNPGGSPWGAQQPVSKYASGRTSGASEWAIVDEAGAELVTRQRGRLTYLESGDGVIPNDITERLLALGANPTRYMSAAMSGITSSVRPQGNVTNVPVNVQYGDIIVQGKADRATVNDIAKLLESNGEALAQAVYKATRKSAMRQGYGF